MAEILTGTGAQRSGKTAKVTVNGEAIVLQSYNVQQRGDDLDTVNFESEGYDEGILGIEGLDWNFRGDWNASRTPWTDPPGIYPRDDLAHLRFFLHTDGAQERWYMRYARVRSANNGAEVRGKVTYEAGGKSQGVFLTPPNGV